MKSLIAVLSFAVLSTAAQAHGGMKGDLKTEETPFGRAADPRKAQRTIRVEMSDQMRFSPSEITVKRGESVRFVPVNKGRVLHEMVLGTMDELKEHAALMRKFPNMEHDEPNMVNVPPGKSGEMGWRFTKPGTFYYGCLQPGHFEAGMVGKVVVAGGAGAADAPHKAAAGQAAAMTEGLVRKVDKDAGKLTLKHGPMPSLGMPAMTMVYRVKEPAMLDGVKAGDKIRFQAENVGGAFTVTHIERAK